MAIGASLSLRRAWIEMSKPKSAHTSKPSRSPYGERGLKFTGHAEQRGGDSRSPYGERGLKSVRRRGCTRCLRRSPYGERGLKLRTNHEYHHRESSLSLRRAWIEIIIVSPFADALRCRSPYGDRGLKCRHGELRRPIAESLSLRRAWIEIFCGLQIWVFACVALLTESVD